MDEQTPHSEQTSDQHEAKVDISNFILISMIGWGTYGRVYLSRKKGGKDDKMLYAIKVVNKEDIVRYPVAIEQIKNERKVRLSIAFYYSAL